ncbi:hypothetical protein A264_22124 [Pseudomonas syringae pv. actinidiae ICMP 19071]
MGATGAATRIVREVVDAFSANASSEYRLREQAPHRDLDYRATLRVVMQFVTALIALDVFFIAMALTTQSATQVTA